MGEPKVVLSVPCIHFLLVPRNFSEPPPRTVYQGGSSPGERDTDSCGRNLASIHQLSFTCYYKILQYFCAKTYCPQQAWPLPWLPASP